MKIYGITDGMKISRKKILALGWKEVHSWADGFGVTFGIDDYRFNWWRDNETVSYLYKLWGGKLWLKME